MFKDKLKIQGWWEPKRSAASNVTYAQLRSSAHQYRHCLFWLWNCICRNSFLYRENRPDGNQENFSFSQRRSEQTSKKKLKYSSLLSSNFSKCVSWGRTNISCVKQNLLRMQAVLYLSFMTNPEFPYDHTQGMIFHKLQVL